MFSYKRRDGGPIQEDRGKHSYLRVYQSSPKRWDDCSKGSDLSATPFGSSALTTSFTDDNVLIALTNRGSIVEEPEEEEEDEYEGEEEDEEKGKEDMTNLPSKESSVPGQVGFGCQSREVMTWNNVGTTIYTPRGERKIERHSHLNRWISLNPTVLIKWLPKNHVIDVRHITRSVPPTSRPTSGSLTITTTSDKDFLD